MSYRNFKVKVSVSPSGVVKVSDGLAIATTNNTVIHSPLVNRSELQWGGCVEEIREHCLGNSDAWLDISASDVPKECRALNRLIPGKGGLGNKSKMSRKTSRALSERMAAIELWADAGVFVTLTLPIQCELAYEALARQSSYAVNRLTQYFRNNFNQENYARCGVWEYQRRGALHYHLYLGVNENFWDDFAMSESLALLSGGCVFPIDLMAQFRLRLARQWENILDSVGLMYGIKMVDDSHRDRLSNYQDLGQRFCNVQIVEKSVSAYLSEYLSESNHGKDKNYLRARNYPIATWAQWDRKATDLYKEYSYSDSVLVDDLESFHVLRKVLFDVLECVENTGVLETENAFYRSVVCIAKARGNTLKRLVRDWFSDMAVLSHSRKNKQEFRVKNVREILEKEARRQLEHDAEMERMNRVRMWRDFYTENLCKIPLNLLHLLRYCDKLLLAEKASKPIQLEFDYAY
jgi:hypothetical protein